MKGKAKYPSLYADVEPASSPDGHRGSTVRCTATRRELGFVWWSHRPGTGVTWHYRCGTVTGDRNTERNAVQALRDLSNGASARPLPEGREELPTAVSPQPVERAARAVPDPPPPAPVPQQIVWGDSAPDLTSAVADAFRRRS